jgi:hypothetical protein
LNRPVGASDFVGPEPTPALRRVKQPVAGTDIDLMDAEGARLLAARIKAGVWIGMRVELVDAGGESQLSAGDRGVVEAIDEHGRVVVKWDRGFSLEVDPEHSPLRRLAA